MNSGSDWNTSILQVNYCNFFTHFAPKKYHEVWQSWNDTKEMKELSRFMPTEKGRTLKSKPTGVRQESIEPSVKPGLVWEQFSLGPEFLTLFYLFWEILNSKICSLNFGLNILFTAQWSSIYQSFRKPVQTLQLLNDWQQVWQEKLSFCLPKGSGLYVIVPSWHLHPTTFLPKYYIRTTA